MVMTIWETPLLPYEGIRERGVGTGDGSMPAPSRRKRNGFCNI